jgi:hypothetical protein
VANTPIPKLCRASLCVVGSGETRRLQTPLSLMTRAANSQHQQLPRRNTISTLEVSAREITSRTSRLFSDTDTDNIEPRHPVMRAGSHCSSPRTVLLQASSVLPLAAQSASASASLNHMQALPDDYRTGLANRTLVVAPQLSTPDCAGSISAARPRSPQQLALLTLTITTVYKVL